MHPLMSPLSISGTTADPITNSDIRDLQTEAGESGDRAQVHLCKLALAGDEAARHECEAAVLEARTAR